MPVVHIHIIISFPTHTLTSDESDAGSGDEGVPGGGGAKGNPVAVMQEKLKELSAAHDLVIKNNAQLVKQIAEIESGMVGGAAGWMSKLKEKLALFKLTSDAMAKVIKCVSVLMQPNLITFVRVYRYMYVHVHGSQVHFV